MISPECFDGKHDNFLGGVWGGCLGLVAMGPEPGLRMGHHVRCDCDCHKHAEELAEGKNYQQLLTGQEA